ncbi:replication protein A 70 kDa DNA-binding subunit-like [Ctenocephalides felis]|uniref:replication protein A 70 kDa DNA-binding subunit-like n=1 Tax=Ctenocephalides felis TaxID=7515 RepID=UPI000E6E4C0C|nr:replication protein A 70 kDa DNA-binding subunit-like [Ctenocephalides felis]
MAYQCGNRKITIRALIDDRAGQTSSSGVSEAVTGVPSPSTGNSYNKKRRYENDISNIASLTHSQQNWTIKAKVEEKSDKKPWSNKNGNGHCFSMALSDNSGKIRAVAFNDQCHKFYEMIQEGKIYTISKFDVKLRKKEFRTFNDYEIVLRNDTQVAECLDVGNKVRKDSYEFVKIKDIQAKKTNTLVGKV